MNRATTITPVTRRGAGHPLSWFQERMWMLNQKNPHDLSYDIPVVFLLEGELDVASLNKSLTQIISRHETLRALYKTNDRGEIVQIINPPQPFELTLVHVEEGEISRYIEENARHVFDLENGPIIKGQLLRINPKRHILLLNVHHIAADGWSVESILFSELQQCYAAFSTDGKPQLSPLPVQYTDFAHWQRKIDLSEGLAYWHKHLEGYEASLELPADFLRTPDCGKISERLEHIYPKDFSESLERFAQTNGCTMFMCLLAALALTVKRYTGKQDLCIGTTTSGRILPEIEQLIGFFVNILPLRVIVDEDMTVEEFMNSVRSSALSGFDHQAVPFERIVYSSAIERGDQTNPLLPLVIRHQNFPRTHLQQSNPGGIRFCSYPGHEGYRTATGKDAVARCEIELSFTGDRNKLEVEVMYASDLYRASTIQNLLKHHEQLLREMMTSGKKKLFDLTMFTESDRQRLFVEYNSTRCTTGDKRDFVTRWDEQVLKNPDALACCDSRGKWSYREIASAANLFASKLTKRGVKPGDVVGICMERSATMLAAMLSIWKAGAAYVPLDPSYPESYLNLITRDAQPKLTVCTLSEKSIFGLKEDACLVVDGKLPVTTDNAFLEPARVKLKPEDLAYLMYTSGSTGTPKGVRVPHRQLINWFNNLESNWPFTRDEMVAQKTTIAFAVSVKEIFAGLLNGCPLTFIETDRVKDPALFVNALIESKATRVNLVPSHMMSMLFYMKESKISLPSLRYCTTAGEPLTAEMVMMFREIIPGAKLLNNYGCTELNDMTYYDTEKFDGTQGFVPVGKPIQNTQVYVLDQLGRPVPQGVPGEMHVASAGMSLGYHRLEDFTKERFIKNPFGSDYGGILYNTGDVVRYLGDGNLEYLGRWDFQVKIRGFRVDVRHVEKVMGEYEGMGYRAVVGEKGRLLAFFVRQPGIEVDIKKLRLFLEKNLPSYMVPSAFIALDELPKLPNGKLNRRGLKVTSGILQQSDTYQAPTSAMQRLLAELWSEVLEIPEERIGKRAHFFELGGHSLSATRLTARIKVRMGLEIALSKIFEYPRLDELASKLTQLDDLMETDDDSVVQKPRNTGGKLSHKRQPGLLEDKVVLVTGGSRGIGRSTVRLLASQGASVAVNYFRSDKHAHMIKEIVEEDGGNAEIFQADTTNPSHVEKLVEQVRNHYGKIDVVVSNAAIGFKILPFTEINWTDFERKLTDELKSMFLLCQAVVPEMAERKSGSIIAVSSTMSKFSRPGYCAHGSAKAALDAFVRALAAELGPEGIRVNTVAPGLTLTDSTTTMSNRIKETAAANCPLRRNGLPRDIAGAILFLASDLSQFMTGTYLPVDGGYTML